MRIAEGEDLIISRDFLKDGKDENQIRTNLEAKENVDI